MLSSELKLTKTLLSIFQARLSQINLHRAELAVLLVHDTERGDIYNEMATSHILVKSDKTH